MPQQSLVFARAKETTPSATPYVRASALFTQLSRESSRPNKCNNDVGQIVYERGNAAGSDELGANRGEHEPQLASQHLQQLFAFLLSATTSNTPQHAALKAIKCK